ncbi:MAG TPA: hypothetical protein GXX49_08830 [Clostridiaceae bacterium]|jgi:hypothetical protein|nr:hypothetical protein [Clostridiaceae bacterium]
MNQFYAVTILIGSAMIFAAFFMVLADWKKLKVSSTVFDEKKQELMDLIEDADLMIEELNKLSEYIFSKADQKNTLLNQTLEVFNSKYSKIQAELENGNSAGDLKNPNTPGQSANMDYGDTSGNLHDEDAVILNNTVIKRSIDTESIEAALSNTEKFASNSPVAAYQQAQKLYEKAKNPQAKDTHKEKNKKSASKITNPTYKKVLALSEKGMSEIEIARNLNMGRGEIQLILDLHR